MGFPKSKRGYQSARLMPPVFFMSPLREHIRKNGFDYHQVKATDKGYIYMQKDGEKTVAFEVFKHKENTQFDCVSFPGNEAFGQWAWTYRNIDEAIERLNKF